MLDPSILILPLKLEEVSADVLESPQEVSRTASGRSSIIISLFIFNLYMFLK